MYIQTFYKLAQRLILRHLPDKFWGFDDGIEEVSLHFVPHKGKQLIITRILKHCIQK